MDVRPRLVALTDGRPGFVTATESKGVLSLSTSSSSSAPSAPIEVLPFGHVAQSPKKGPRSNVNPKVAWSALDALVVGVAVVTIALSALALAWFLAS